MKVTILLFLLIMGVPVVSLAQTGMGSIAGHVSDSTGAALPGAKVTITNTATGVSIDSTTNASGIYLVQPLNPGTYRVEAVAPRFKTTVRDGLTLDVDGKLGIDLKLEVGGGTETVTVTAAAPLLRTEDAESGEVMNTAVIENFPNLSGNGEVRNVLGALQYSGDIEGSYASGGRAGAGIGINGNMFSFSNLRVNGGRTSDTEYLVDGIPITQNMDRQLSPTVPTVEDTSEFKVVTNGLGAQYGHLSGGAIDLATQTGTKDLHGSFFDFSQAAALDANSWDNDDTIINGKPFPKPGFHQNDFGVAIGGPVYLPHLYHGQKKTFWFFNYEGSRYNTGGNVVLSSVLTALERTGDVSDMGVAGDPNHPQPHMYDPHGASTYPNLMCDDGSGPPPCANSGANQAYLHLDLLPNNGTKVPSNYLDPIIQQYLNPKTGLMPLPTPGLKPVPNSTTGNNFAQAQKITKSTDVYSIRIDENITEKSRMFARFSHNNGSNVQSPSYGPNGPTTSTLTPNGFGATINYDYTFSPTLLLNLRAGGNYAPFSTGTFIGSAINVSAFGFDATTLSLVTPQNILPPIAGPWTEAKNVGVDNWNNGGGTEGPNPGTSLLNSTNIVYAASLTKILKRHSLQFGYEGRRYYDNFANSAEQTPSNNGQGFRFTSQSSDQYAENANGATQWNPQGYANGVGDFLMGLYAWNQNNSGFTNALRQNYYAAYAQDDFKATSKLNLSIGIRWETESPVSTNKNGTLTIWDEKAPSPFTMAQGWSWAGALAQAQDSSGNPTPLSPTLLSEVQTPNWVAGGFPKGALEFVGTPQHPSMSANDWHPWNFSPRLGAAWQVREDTVIRASLGAFYLPTGGSLNGYSQTNGVAYTSQDGNGTHTQVQTTGVNLSPVLFSKTDPTCGCVETPSFPGQTLSATQKSPTANLLMNQQSAANGGAGAVDTKSHMPLEYNWSLGVQYEVKHGFLFEAVYNGNTSHDLLAKDNPGHFPASLFTGGSNGDNSTIYTTYVPSPTAGQVPSGGYADKTQTIGYLEYAYPYFGQLQIGQRNIGKSNFNSLNLRVEHRLSDGFQILANYTISKSMDDVGGPETGQSLDGGYGQGGKAPQDVQTIRDVYGLSGLDEPRRLTLFALYQVPLGRGRRWMNQRSNVGGGILDYVIGGWNVSGDFITTPGSPISFESVNQSGTNTGPLDFHNIYGSYAAGATAYSLKNPHWGGAKSSTYNGETQSSSVATPAFDTSQFVPAAAFTVGTLPPIYNIIRNPDNWSSDMSLSKNIPLFSADGARYLQVRMDDTNFLNHPGLGGYDTNLNDGPTLFGTINLHGNHFQGERHIQLGARIVF